jgi:hypothetical protein
VFPSFEYLVQRPPFFLPLEYKKKAGALSMPKECDSSFSSSFPPSYWGRERNKRAQWAVRKRVVCFGHSELQIFKEGEDKE